MCSCAKRLQARLHCLHFTCFALFTNIFTDIAPFCVFSSLNAFLPFTESERHQHLSVCEVETVECGLNKTLRAAYLKNCWLSLRRRACFRVFVLLISIAEFRRLYYATHFCEVGEVECGFCVQEKNEEKMTCNMMLAELQTKLDKCQNTTVSADYQWADVSRQLSHRTLVLGRVSMWVPFKKTQHQSDCC